MSLQNTVDAAESAARNTSQELFALTDEQILGIGPEEVAGAEERTGIDTASAPRPADSGLDASRRGERSDENPEVREAASKGHTGAAVSVPVEPPKWLADKMKDPWLGDEARALWASMQKVQNEAAAFREVFANPEDARALKELYPGGVTEAKSAAERARQLEEIDGAYFGAAGKSPQELSAGRVALAQRLFAQDAAAFREMVREGVRLLEAMGGEASDKGKSLAASAKDVASSPAASSAQDKRHDNSPPIRQLEVNASPETVNSYRAFEKAANAELEKTVGAEISRRMEQALPNLRQMRAPGASEGQPGALLQERLGTAVREEIDAALKSDAQLGEQVAHVLAGRRFDDAARVQVVRLIDTRAQQLVPSAVRKVVGQWTQATLGARGKRSPSEETERADIGGANKSGTAAATRMEDGRDRPAKGQPSRARRVEYGKMSDEQILEM
jgi:hypothetical protein